MARKADRKLFSVSVVGFSGTEKEKGVEGIGKSCLCNRFVRPLADDYKVDHISVLSQSDFSGRVVNNDHFLYWGEVTKVADDGSDMTFHVIEQTEFIDDTSFQPFKSGKTEPYYKRCATVKLTSAEKLAYICKNQLGLEHEFDEKLLPDGKFNVDGFLCLFDVSVVHQRSFEKQLEYTNYILSNIVKTKKPVVFVTTKNDRLHDAYVREAEKLVNKHRGNIMIVETSSHENVNVDLAFYTIAHLIDRTKGRPKISLFAEAAKARKEVLEVAKDAYKHLVRSKVTDHRAMWMPILRQIQPHPDYIHFVELFGTDQAKKIFHQQIGRLREDFIQRRHEMYINKLRELVKVWLPDLATISDRSWPATLRWLQRLEAFEQHVVVIPEGRMWWEPEFLEGAEERIPLSLLEEDDEAEVVFREHVNALRSQHKRHELCRQFKQLLEDNHNVGPGKSLGEVAIFFLGRECFSVLSEEDKSNVYEQHQRELKERAKVEFQELLLEQAELFSRFDPNAPITNDDLREIDEKLRDEPRYRALARLEEDRRVLLLNHLGFMQCPSRKACPMREDCVEGQLDDILATKAHRPQSWSNNSQFMLDSADNHVNLVILGSHNLADAMAQEIRSLCIEDEYSLDGTLYSLDYRTIDGDVTLPHNSFTTPDFIPHGCICVYNGEESFEYVRESLEKTLISDRSKEDRTPFQGLPVVIIMVLQDESSNSGKLREQGKGLAERLQCPFMDLPGNVSQGRLHLGNDLESAVRSLLSSVHSRFSLINHWQVAESIEPDICILMCFMCGDHFNMEIPLSPLLNHQCCYVTSDEYPTIILESYLDDNKRKVEVTLLSYHGAILARHDRRFHGYVLVFSPKRKASLATLRSFVRLVPSSVPVKLLAVAESGAANAFFSSEVGQSLLTEGNALADQISASFMVSGPNFQQQTAAYTPFFKEVWERKADTESAFPFSESEDNTPIMEPELTSNHHIARRLPAVLPKPPPPKRYDSFTATNKSSTSNSTEESEAMYDQVHRPERGDSDSGPVSRASSASPPVCDSFTPDDTYSEVASCDTDHLIKPSQLVKNRRSMYAVWYDDVECDSTAPLLDQMENPAYESSGPPRSPPPPQTLPKPRIGPKPLDVDKFADVRQVLNRNIKIGKIRDNKAPLALPEAIEIGDYATVKDALACDGLVEETNYARVHDALPAGKLHRIRYTLTKSRDPSKKLGDGVTTESDSEFSSLERLRDDIYARVNRRPTPHKKKTKPRHSDSSLPPPPLPPYTEDRNVFLRALPPVQGHSSDGSDGTGDEMNLQKQKPTKKRRSFRQKKKQLHSDSSMAISPPWSDSDLGTPYQDSPKGMDDDAGYDQVSPRMEGSPRRFVDDGEDIDGLPWRKKFWIRQDKDSNEKQKRKEEKKAKEDERRKIKEEEKKMKEQQKLQRKLKKKDAKSTTSSGSISGQGGQTLEDLVTCKDQMVPLFVEKCVTFIEEEGLAVEGIYRVPGNRQHVDLLLERFKEDPNVDIHSLDIPVNAVATALKGFFKDLAEPVIPNSLYDELLDSMNIRDRQGRHQALRDIIHEKLNGVNFEVLKYIVTHIHRVGQKSSENSMDSKNLAICWWPTLLQPSFTTFEKMTMASKMLEEIVQSLIDEYMFFFYEEESEV